MIGPSPEKATLLILGGTLDLPVRPPQVTDALLSLSVVISKLHRNCTPRAFLHFAAPSRKQTDYRTQGSACSIGGRSCHSNDL
jgi:hypothetical protein